MNFCSKCGSPSPELVIPEGDSVMRYVCEFCKTIHYENPKMVVGCLPVWEGQILLAKRAIEPRQGLWNLPCGYLENGEIVQEGAKREVYEETGAQVEVQHLHCVYDLPHAKQVYLIFLAKMQSADFRKSTSESLEVRLFSPHEIPWKEIAFSSSTFALEKYLANTKATHVNFGKFDKTQ